MTKCDKSRQPYRQEGGGYHDSVLHDFDLRFPIARIFAPFLHRFCTMKPISELYHPNSGEVFQNSQPIDHERVATERGIGRANLGKEMVKFWMLYQPLTSIDTGSGQQKVKKR